MKRYKPLFEAKAETKFAALKTKVQSLLNDGFKFVDGYIRQGNETFLILNNTLTKVKTISNWDIPVYGSLENIIDASKK